MYARAIYVGRALKLRYGKWVSCVEDNQRQRQQYAELQRDDKDRQRSVQVVLGRLFISLARHPAFTDQIIAGLRLARLI